MTIGADSLVPSSNSSTNASSRTLSVFSSNGLVDTQSRTQDTRNRVLVFDCLDLFDEETVDGFVDESFELTHCRGLHEIADRLTICTERAERPFDLVIWNLTPPFDEGLRALRALREAHSNFRVVLLASQEALAHAASIKGAGVESLVLKPVRLHDLKSGVERALKRTGALEIPQPKIDARPTHALTRAFPHEEKKECGLDLGLIGSSPEILKVISLIRKVGPSNVNVLVTGESGTGKEMVAQAIHKVSDRAGKPFIAINCAAIPRELLESELFGHAKGAFTGASAARRGLFEEANEGTILLDEIGDLPLSLQAKILRLLQTRQVKPLGQNVSKEVDVRIISATHKNLKSLIQKGEFREDLYYRLNVMPIHLSPLRERRDDLIQLAEYFLERNAKNNRRSRPIVLTKKAIAKLQSLPWRGNVRELENVIERAVVLSDGIGITEDEILAEDTEREQVTCEDLFNAGMSLKDIEREYIKHVLAKTGNRKEAATRILGIDRKTLYRKEKAYGIRPSSELN